MINTWDGYKKIINENLLKYLIATKKDLQEKGFIPTLDMAIEQLSEKIKQDALKQEYRRTNHNDDEDEQGNPINV